MSWLVPVAVDAGRKINFAAGLTIGLTILCCMPVQAVTPDAGALQRDQSLPAAPEDKSRGAIDIAVPEEVRKSCEAPYFPVNTVRLQGVTLFPVERFASLTKLVSGDKVCLARLEALAKTIDQYYLQQQFFSRTVIPEQDVSSGVVTLKVIEAKLGRVRYQRPDSGLRLPADKEHRVVESQVTPGEHLNLSKLNKGLRNLDSLPGVKANARLVPSVSVSGSDVIVNMESTPITSSRVVADNLGSRATGQSRLIYQLFLDSPFGQAERVSALAMVSKGTRVLQLGAAVPVGDVGGKLQFNASRLAYEIDGPEGLRGSAWSPSISVSWPQFFSSTVQSTESVSVSYNRLQNEALNLEISDKRITSLDVRSEGNLLLADSPVSYRVGLRVGDADLSNNASDLKQDAQTAGVNGGFWRLSTDLAYSQRLNDSVELRIRARGQYSADNLDSSQKMSLGGRYGVRAYPVGEAAASTAGLVQAGLRVAVQEQLAASVFADVGWVQLNPDPWIGWQSNNSALENEYHLAGLGVGLDWKPLPGIRFTANAAHSVGNNPGRSSEGKDADGRDGDYRAWLELSVSF